MCNDPIVEETRKLREAYSAQHDHDVHRIAEDLRQWQKAGMPITLGALNEPDSPGYLLQTQKDVGSK